MDHQNLRLRKCWKLFSATLSQPRISENGNFGELSNRQKQAIVTLIEKTGKDKRLIKNWRLISLIHLDAKIISKVLAKRLGKVLPYIIHANQNAFVKGRSVFDALRTIDHVVDYTKRNCLPGILIAISPLHDPVTWYGINYTGTQVTQWDFQNRGTRTSQARLSFLLEVPLRNLRPSVTYSVPLDRIVQRAY